MQVSVETTEGLGRRMTVAVPAEKIDTEISKRLRSMAPRVKIAGFRPGKVPFKIVEQRYAGQVRAEVMGDMLSSSFYEAVTQEKLRPAGQPTITDQNMEEGKGLEFTAEFEVYPDIEVKGVDKIKLERMVAEISDTDIDGMIEKLRGQRKTWEEVDRAAANDDQVIIDFKGFIGDEVFQGGEGKEVPLVLGSKSMIDGFEDALVGASAGDSLEANVTFPEDYRSSDLAGKEARFELKVHRVEQSVLPELNEEFIKSLGIEAGTQEALKQDVRDNMTKESQRIVKTRLKRQVLDALLEKNKVDVPQVMVNEEASRLAQQMQDQKRMSQGQSTENEGVSEESFKEEGQRRIALGLIMSEIIKQNNLKAEPEAVRAEVERMATSYGGIDPQVVIQWYYSDPQRLSEIESIILEEKVVDWVLEKAQVTDNMTPFEDLVSAAN